MAPYALFITAIFFLQGSASRDLPNPPEIHPFEPCPDSPNCIIQSVSYDRSPQEIYRAAFETVDGMRVHSIAGDSQSLQIEAVFRIRLFGFKDDVRIAVEETPDGALLHIKSASRVGHSDLGVNRRRVQNILNGIQNQL